MADTSAAIKQYLLQDVVDSTPAAIMTENPQFTSAAQVPQYLYTSLCTLWTGTSGNVTELSRTIIADLGVALTGPRRYISIQPFICESADARNEGLDLDTDGAENATINILFHVNKLPMRESPFNNLQTDYGIIELAELRIRHLLDANLRKYSFRPQDLIVDNSQGLSINPNGTFKCIWRAFGSVGSETELVSQYSVTYVRNVGYANIP